MFPNNTQKNKYHSYLEHAAVLLKLQNSLLLSMAYAKYFVTNITIHWSVFLFLVLVLVVESHNEDLVFSTLDFR
jgi:hypothetical protein